MAFRGRLLTSQCYLLLPPGLSQSVVHECLLCGTLDSNISPGLSLPSILKFRLEYAVYDVYLLLKLKMEMPRIKSSMKDCEWVG